MMPTPAAFRDEFPLDADLIYLNHAAVAPWPRRTARAVQQFAEENLRRGASAYPAWLLIEQRLRERAARLLGIDSPGDIALLKNTSEALSLVAYGLGWTAGDRILISNQEFPSNRVVWESLADQGVRTSEIDISGPDPEAALIASMDSATRLLSISSVQYASGLRLDLARLGAACRERGILFCVDAIQSLGALPFDVVASQADFVMADGHKWLLGPEGCAIFYAHPRLRERLHLLQYGWHMLAERGDYDARDWHPAPDATRFECGSPNMLGIHGLEASLGLLEEVGLAEIGQRVLANTGYLIGALERLPGIRLVTPKAADRHAGIVSFRHREINPQTLFEGLRQAGVVCALRGGALRFSPHFHTPRAQLEAAVELVDRLCQSG